MGSDSLFVMPSFLQGMGSVLDIAGTRELTNYNESRSPREADAQAMANDWYVVAGDMRVAANEVAEEIHEEEVPPGT